MKIPSLPLLVGGLLPVLNETCPGGSFIVQASRAFHGLVVSPVDVAACGDVITGLLPLLAQSSVPHRGVVHRVGDGVEWAQSVRGPAWSLPCFVVLGLDAPGCKNLFFTSLEERLQVWCSANEFILRVAAGRGSPETTYLLDKTASPSQAARTKPARAALSEKVRACLRTFN
jgi:hypothetical protein